MYVRTYTAVCIPKDFFEERKRLLILLARRVPCRPVDENEIDSWYMFPSQSVRAVRSRLGASEIATRARYWLDKPCAGSCFDLNQRGITVWRFLHHAIAHRDAACLPAMKAWVSRQIGRVLSCACRTIMVFFSSAANCHNGTAAFRPLQDGWNNLH